LLIYFSFRPEFCKISLYSFYFCGDLKHFPQFARNPTCLENLTIFKTEFQVCKHGCEALQTQRIQAQTKCVLHALDKERTHKQNTVWKGTFRYGKWSLSGAKKVFRSSNTQFHAQIASARVRVRQTEAITAPPCNRGCITFPRPIALPLHLLTCL
jgi:hypothetical protein